MLTLIVYTINFSNHRIFFLEIDYIMDKKNLMYKTKKYMSKMHKGEYYREKYIAYKNLLLQAGGGNENANEDESKNIEWVEIDISDPRVYGSPESGASIPPAEFYRATNHHKLDTIGDYFLKRSLCLRIDFSDCMDVVKIGNFFLASCVNLGKSDVRRLYLPPQSMKGLYNVTTIGIRPFFSCQSLKYLDYPTTMPNIISGGEDAFLDSPFKKNAPRLRQL
jgi:hypothetical protein